MDNFTLAGLKGRFDQEIAQTGKVILDRRTLGARKNLDFVATLLSEQLALTNVRATLDQSASPGKLTVTGNPETDWMIQGVSGAGMTSVSVVLIYQDGVSGVSDSAMVFEGALTIGGQPILCSGSLAEGGGLVFVLKEGHAVRAPLQAAADFVAGSRMTASYLPMGVGLFATIPITAIELTFGLSYTAPTNLRLTSDVGGPWTFIDGINLEPLKKVGFRLFSAYTIHPNLQVRTTYGGDIHADFELAGHDLEARLALNPTDVWEIALAPKSGGTLPGLIDLANALGVKAAVQTGLNALGLGDISVLGVAVGFNLKARRLLYFSIAGRVQIADVDFDLWIRLPDFQFGGGLARGASISFRKIVEHFFSAAHNLPDVIVEEFALAAHPSQGAYSLMVDLREEGFTLGPVTLEGLNLVIEKTPQGFDGSMSATLAIAQSTIYVTARRPNPAAGWQFEGGVSPGQTISIGALVDELAKLFGNDLKGKVPASIKDLTIEDLGVWFDAKSKDFKFTCKTQFPVDSDAKVTLAVSINFTHENNSYVKDFRASIEVKTANLKDPLIFTLKLVDENAQGKITDLFVATYSGGTQRITIGDLIRGIVQANPAPEWTRALDGVAINLKSALFAFNKTGAEKKFLFGLDIGTNINLSELPLVGQKFPRDQQVGVDDLQILVASKPFSRNELTSLNNIIGATQGVTALPVPTQNGDGGADNAISQGLTLSARMRFGAAVETLSLPAGAGTQPTGVGNQAAPTAATPTTSAPATTDNTKWYTLQKNFGPVTFNRVGVRFQDQRLWFLLDAALAAAGLTLALDGLSVDSPLNEFHPEFKLRGLGIDYKNGPVSIGGAFLWRQIEIGGKKYDEYDGAALIKTPQFALSAIGSYADLDGHPSLFVYAVLDYPLGGPSFFFVTGLAAGFGYNRSLRAPTIEQVSEFPLVAQAISGPRAPNNLEAELQSLQQYIPPAIGEVFLAVGIKFTSFKIIDSFVLLTVAFGNRFEINLLGLSTLISPPQAPANTPPLSVVQMAIKVSFIPDEGFLGAQAQLTPASYIFTRDCHITGGFAFYSWFSGNRAGEFVITLGGYHPSFNVPDYYPRVPRLGISWRVNDNLNIKGGAYYALTSSALMAGGSLQATWQDGNLKAWFNAGADFLISWKPYHYDARIYVNMGVSYTFTVDLWVTTIRKTISVDIGADLHIWGPEFSGTAHIKLWIVSFDVNFGAAASQQPKPIGWDEFRTSFLPGDTEVCGIAIKSGLVRTTEAKQWVVNPKDFCLVTDSMIPSKTCFVGNKQLQLSEPVATDFGVGSMGVAPANLSTRHKIEINRIIDKSSQPPKTQSVEADFDFVPLKKKAPAGLWGKSLTPSVNGQGYIEQALSGFEIRPKARPAPGVTADIDRANLQYDPTNVQNAFYWETFKPFNSATEDDDARRERIRASLTRAETVAARNQLLRDLGLSVNLTLNGSTADAFSVPPQVGTMAG
jgi:hypothetical protein